MSELPENTIMALDLTRPVQTRGGRPARILTTEAKYRSNGFDQPIIAVLGEDDYVGFWSIDGTFDPLRKCSSDLDLINVPPKKTTVAVCVRLYRDPMSGVYSVSMIEGQPRAWDNDFIAETFIEMEYEESQP
jgi:hypothetical protein